MPCLPKCIEKRNVPFPTTEKLCMKKKIMKRIHSDFPRINGSEYKPYELYFSITPDYSPIRSQAKGIC